MAANTSHVSFFVPQELRDQIEQAARANDRTLSAEIRRALRAHISSNPSAAVVSPGRRAAEGKGAASRG